MFSGIKKSLGIVSVSQTPKYITVEGIDTFMLMRDLYRTWQSNQVGNQMFSFISGGKLRFLHFFGLDFLYICEKLKDDPQTRSSRRMLNKVIIELKEHTWLGDIDREIKSITDLHNITHVVPFALKPFQVEFAKHVGKLVPAYRLRGYMLDAGPGTGKTVCQLVLASCLHARKVIMVVPKNSVVDVWENTIKNILIKKEPYWLSTSNEALTTDKHFYICHFEQLGQMLEFVKANLGAFKDTYIGLDESHNFNRLASDRTGAYLELVSLPGMIMNIWASGTPIQALGIECIPYLKATDPMFNEEAEERFRKIYGRDAKRANDILRNRIGHLKFHVPKQDVVDIAINTTVLNVKMPGGKEYTLEAIGEKMRKFITERDIFYTNHKKEFQRDYDEALLYFEHHGHPNKADYAAYKAAVALISKGFDPKLMKAEAALANGYERKTIIPALPNNMKEGFRKAKSVVKYVNLTIMGECLGTVLGGSRSKCHMEMVEHIDFGKLVDDARKKTMIFTSFVEVLQKAAKLIQKDGYETVEVYGATNKNLPAMIKSFYNDEDINPLLATYPSLSTAVPVTIASRLILLNQPFRDAIRQQTIARAARLGQDGPVDVVDVLLDTGDQPNISTRSNDIMTWSAEMTASILGVNNVDLDSMQLEAKADWYGELTELACEAADVSPDVLDGGESILSKENNQPLTKLPAYLYHSSAYKQTELMPGFKRSGELVKWDKVEDNTWLYTADRKDEAIMLGISSAIEKKWDLQRYKYNDKTKVLDIEVVDQHITKADIEKLTVWIYTIRPDAADGWVENYNPVNGLKGEYKTQGVVDSGIVRVEPVDIHEALRKYTINIKQVPGESFESFSDLIRGVKSLFVKQADRKEEHAKVIPKKYYGVRAEQVEAYLKEFYGNSSWLAKQSFNQTVSSSDIAQPLSVNGKFLESLAAINTAIDQYIHAESDVENKLTKLDAEVQRIDKKFQALLTAAIKKDDHDEVDSLALQAHKEFGSINIPFKGMKFELLGGDVCTGIAQTTSDDRLPVEMTRKEIPVKVAKEIKALTSAEVTQAVKMIERLLAVAKASKSRKYHEWLDFEDGSDFSSLIHEYDETDYMIYYQLWYFQSVDQDLGYGLPGLSDLVSDTIVGLLHWMDRSIK